MTTLCLLTLINKIAKIQIWGLFCKYFFSKKVHIKIGNIRDFIKQLEIQFIFSWLCCYLFISAIFHFHNGFQTARTSRNISMVKVVHVFTCTEVIKTFNSTYSLYYFTWLNHPYLFSTVLCGFRAWVTIRYIL